MSGFEAADSLAGADRRVRQPGPPHPDRIESFAGALRTVELALEPGLTIRDAIARPLLAAGVTSGGVQMSGLRLGPVQYVMPTFSKSPEHVAYYSETYKPEGEIAIDYANATFGHRDGAPFIHCHALWREADGTVRGGHILPLDSYISSPSKAIAYGVGDVALVAEFDAETNFTLFRPSAINSSTKGNTDRCCVIARIRPNEDFIGAIEAICRRHGIQEATIRSGVGSIVGAEFEDGLTIDEIPTEIVVTSGRVAPDANGHPHADVEIALIDARGRIHTGRPARGRNPVLICFELILETATATRRAKD